MHVSTNAKTWLAILCTAAAIGCTQRPTNPEGADAVVEGEIQRQLAANPEVASAAPAIKVSAENGTVTLMGAVPSENVKREAEDIAEDVSGVDEVHNQLIVASGPAAAAPVR
jgi:osmotically-inducible protein OsmY